MNSIINQITANFDFSYMLVINVLTYILIKGVDCINGDKVVSTLQKRIILIISIIIITTIYKIVGYNNNIILVNSAIVSPIAWSWILRPIIVKIGLGYKQFDDIN